MRAQRREPSIDGSSPAATRATKAPPRAAPSGTAGVSTGSPVASATAAIQAGTRVPPPLVTTRRPSSPDSSSILRMTKPLASKAARSTAAGPWVMSSPWRLARSDGSLNGVRSPRR